MHALQMFGVMHGFFPTKQEWQDPLTQTMGRNKLHKYRGTMIHKDRRSGVNLQTFFDRCISMSHGTACSVKECGYYEGSGFEHNLKFIYRLLPHMLPKLLVIKTLQ